jgi:hypothetical protein
MKIPKAKIPLVEIHTGENSYIRGIESQILKKEWICLGCAHDGCIMPGGMNTWQTQW